MLRNIIQHRSRFKVLLSGSHTLQEFQRWSSYLINSQTVEIGHLTDDEASQLIEHPREDFPLCYEPNASERVREVTRGHPALIQLLCSEVINIKNTQDISRRLKATVNDVELAIPEALKNGSMFFADLEKNQLTTKGVEGASLLLRFLARKGERRNLNRSELANYFESCILPQYPKEDFERTLEICLRRDVIELAEDSKHEPAYRFQVELIRRWFLHPQQ